MERLEGRREVTSTGEVVRRVPIIAMGVAILGLLVLLAYAASEVAADPTLTLEDGYWIGRTPWTPLGIGLVVSGSTVAIVAGVVSALLTGGNLRRLLSVVVSLPAVFWWLVEALQLQAVGGACPSGACVRPWIDPITNAYSLPQATVLLLLLPAAILTVSSAVQRQDRA